MMTTAQNALIAHPDIKSIVILEHIPRFDKKSEFAKFANNTYQQLWFE